MSGNHSSFCVYEIDYPWYLDRAWDTLPWNNAPWRSGYFKLKEFEVQEGFSELPLRQVIRLSCERCPCRIQRKTASLSLRTEGHWEEVDRPPCFCTLLHLAHTYHIGLPHFPLTLHSSANLADKRSSSQLPWVLIFLRRLLCHRKLMLNRCICCSLVNMSFVIRPLAES